MDQYQEFIYTRTYSRWRPDLGRRERWDETVDRYRDFFIKRVPKNYRMEYLQAIDRVRTMDVMPSMRALWTAGSALERENICGYNCAAVALDHPKAFAELLYILLCGTGVGYSVERQVISKLWEVPAHLIDPVDLSQRPRIVVADSKLGWAEGFYSLLRHLWNGFIPTWDLSRVRPAGTPLKTFGGRASGPEPLDALFKFTVALFRDRRGEKLTSVDCADIANKAAESVVVGGVRRSACIALTNLSDDRMAKYKSGQFYLTHPHRSMANISVAYTEKPSTRKLMSEWIKLIESNTGERGIFNRGDVHNHLPEPRQRLNKPDTLWMLNPCGEILLRPAQFCNLTSVVVRPADGIGVLVNKVRAATILGMLQATLTDFHFLRKVWKDNCERERLLGVSLSGLADHNTFAHRRNYTCSYLARLREVVHTTARAWSGVLGIDTPTAMTCVKPEGTSSQLVGSASGLHSRFARFYLRRVRVATVDPLCQFLIERGIPNQPEVGEQEATCKTRVFEFPQAAPEGSRLNNEFNALAQLDYWLMLKQYWCDHNPSCTIFVKEHEWIDVLNWVHTNWQMIGGLSFLPYSGSAYQLAPLEEIDEETYHTLVDNFPTLDFTHLAQYEQHDQGVGSHELACTGSSCAF